MNYNVITMHNDELNTIIDATIANKAQNTAIKRLVNASCDTLMNRIATGWLEAIKPAGDPTAPKQSAVQGVDGDRTSQGATSLPNDSGVIITFP